MNYLKTYLSIVYDRKFIRQIAKDQQYCECHHIVPRKIKPELEKETSNLVNLTAREHYICHKLLVKICKEEYGIHSKQYKAMVSALFFMSHIQRYNKYVSGRDYETIKINFGKIASDRIKGKNNPMYKKSVTDYMTEEEIKQWKQHISEGGKGKKFSQEHKDKISKANKGQNPWDGAMSNEQREAWKQKIKNKMLGRKMTLEWRKKISNGRKGKKHTNETKERISKLNRGKHHSLEARIKMSKARKGKPFSAEHKINISAGQRGMKWVYNPKTDHQTRITPDKIQEYLAKGYRLGYKPRS